MPAPITTIGISLGSMGLLYDGLGQYAAQLCGHVARHARQWREELGVEFHVHCRESLFGSFGNELRYVPLTRWQRYRHVQDSRYALWHSVHQLNKTLPPRGTGTRLVTVHDLNYLYKSSAWSRWRNHRRTLALLARTDHIVTISRWTADDVRRHLPWRGPIDVIPNGVRNVTATPPEPLPGFDATRPFLFHLSRMSPSKNPQAMLGLAAVWPEMNFLFCGPPTHEARALKQANTLPNVHFRLAISEGQKAWAFAHCAGFLFPSFSEGFGLPPVEAMQFGKPVFLSRLTSLPEVGGEAAYYFDDWAPEAMRAVVERGLAEGAAPGRADAVRRHALSFDPQVAGDRYLDLYRRLLKLPPAPSV